MLAQPDDVTRHNDRREAARCGDAGNFNLIPGVQLRCEIFTIDRYAGTVAEKEERIFPSGANGDKAPHFNRNAACGLLSREASNLADLRENARTVRKSIGGRDRNGSE